MFLAVTDSMHERSIGVAINANIYWGACVLFESDTGTVVHGMFGLSQTSKK